MTPNKPDLDRIEGLAGRLSLCVDDPMWADHAEVSKRLLAKAVADLTALTAYIRELEGALEPFAAAYRKNYDLGVSDLDNEQPIAWHVPLGAYRRAALSRTQK